MVTKIVADEEPTTTVGTAIDWVLENEEPLVLERDGQPQAVLMRFGDYEELQALREQARQQVALAQLNELAAQSRQRPLPPPKPSLSQEERAALLVELETLRNRVRARNQDLTDEEAEALAERFVREVVQEMIDEGKIRYAL